jgi:Kef-type K+ transport system membrane component KefB
MILKFISAIVVGMIFTSVSFAFTTYLLERTDTSNSWLGSNRDFAWLAAAIAAIFGAIIGAVSSAVVGGFQLNTLIFAIFGLAYGFTVFVFFADFDRRRGRKRDVLPLLDTAD